MASLHKIELASEMFLEADRRFREAAGDVDYVVSLLLSGAVAGIVGPLLEEQGGKSSHTNLARIATLLAPNEPPVKPTEFRAAYNALKHAGNAGRKIPPSHDLEVEIDLRHEAAHMLDAAKEDFRQISLHADLHQRLPEQFIQLMESDESYA